MSSALRLLSHQRRLIQCVRCPKMIGPPVTGRPVVAPVMLVGQAPGSKEIAVRKPFAWTAGKTLFGWFQTIGLNEEEFRHRVYMAAVCRCFPGKNAGGGDRVPDQQEIANCSGWLEAELTLLQPRLIIPTGRLAIALFLAADKLDQVVGKKHRIELDGFTTDIVPLPHPSGASTWHRTEPGETLLKKALGVIERHAAWREIQTGHP